MRNAFRQINGREFGKWTGFAIAMAPLLIHHGEVIAEAVAGEFLSSDVPAVEIRIDQSDRESRT